MKKIIILAIIAMLLVSLCLILLFGSDFFKDKNNGDEALLSQIKYYPTYNSEYKTIRNDVFDFWFDIPNDWEVTIKSSDEGEYFIIAGDSKVILKTYGVLKSGTDEQFYKKLAGKSGKIEDLDFRDGTTGKKIHNSKSEVYYIRNDNDTYICFYINYKDDTAWFEKKTEQLEYIGTSLRIIQESFGRDPEGENKINLDDLKLGDINIDMSYDNVIKAMKADLLKEESDGLGKTAYFSDGTQIYFVDGTVYSMNVNSGNYATPRGLKTGDDMEKVRELYGEPDNSSDETHWGYTLDGYELFSVVFKEGKVAEIQIDMVM